jgi:dephospho-CoA kinase
MRGLMAPLTIGLTGGIAAGKSEALAAFGRLGAATLSSDAVVHDLLEGEPLRGELTARWGEEVAPPGEPTDRGRIGGIVFADPTELAWLESTIHPAVSAATAAWIAGLPAETEFAVIEVPLLFEGGREKVFDTTVSIVAAEDVRRERAAARGHALVDAREARQLTQEEKADRADHVVVNDGSVDDLEAALSALLAKLQG